MGTNAYEAYLESKVMAAEGVELVRLLYRAALDSVRQARAHLAAGRIMERSRAVSRASEILNELALSVDHAAGGGLSRNLVELYAYLQQLLLEGNARQQERPLAEAEQLLASLLEAWENCPSHPASATDAAETGISPDYTPLSCTC